MSVSCCMHHALDIGRRPPEQWAQAIQDLPDICQRPTVCGAPKSCRKRVGEYLRMQWRIRREHARVRGERT